MLSSLKAKQFEECRCIIRFYFKICISIEKTHTKQAEDRVRLVISGKFSDLCNIVVSFLAISDRSNQILLS